jgi:hypothetical protein
VTDLPAAKLKDFAEGSAVEAGEAAAEAAIRELSGALPWLRA